MITVKQLRDLLEKMPQHAVVVIDFGNKSECYVDVNKIEHIKLERAIKGSDAPGKVDAVEIIGE